MKHPTPAEVELLLIDLETATEQDRDDTLAAFLVACYPTLGAQNA